MDASCFCALKVFNHFNLAKTDAKTENEWNRTQDHRAHHIAQQPYFIVLFMFFIKENFSINET